ncbi:MAG: FtsX-like permease family protein [bacterium]|nr:FtsX-like permease family protein [bacterium]
MMLEIFHDLRSCFRSLRRRPAYAAVSVTILALGLAASTTLFTNVNAFLQRIPGVADAGRMVHVNSLDEDGTEDGLSFPDYLDLAAGEGTFEGLAATGLFGGNLRDDRGTYWLWARIVSGNFFSVLGVEMSAGRGFTSAADDPGAVGVCVLSHDFWQRRYGGEDVVGRVVYIDGRPFTITGVAAPQFRTVYAGYHPELWFPFSQFRALRPDRWQGQFGRRDRTSVGAFGRLRPGIDLAAAQAHLKRMASHLDREYPLSDGPRRLRMVPAMRFIQPAREANLPNAWLMLAAAGVLLLVACANVANVLYSVALGRRREVALRATLGASPGRIVRLLLIENLVLGLAAGALGLCLVRPACRWLESFYAPPSVLGAWDAPELMLDLRVFGFALALSITAGLVAGLLPALGASRRDLVTVLKGHGDAAPGRRRLRARDLLVSFQVALSVVLLVIAGLVLRTFQRAQQVDPGFKTDHLLTATLSIRSKQLPVEVGKRFFQQLADRIGTEPGVRVAAVTRSAPFSVNQISTRLGIEGRSEPERISITSVGKGYLDALGLELRRGRRLDDRDTASAGGAVMISEALAHRFFPGLEPLGRRLTLPADAGEPERSFEIVGVVADARIAAVLQEPEPLVYFSFLQYGFRSGGSLLVRTEIDPAALIPALGRQLHEIDPDLAVINVQSYTEILRGELADQRSRAELFSALAVLGLALAAAGAWSVLNLAVTRRRRELGIRMALGARADDIVALVIRRGLLSVSLGLGIGLAAALAAGRLVESLLYGVEATDLPSFAVGAATLLVVTIVACYLPARRAAAIDPLETLRRE